MLGPPAVLEGHTAIYDPGRHRMVVFGGFDGSLLHGDTWVLSFDATPAWSELIPSGTPPSGRMEHSAIYDPVRDRIVVFGGDDGSGSYRNDTWVLSLAGTPAWSELIPSGTPPSGRIGHTAIYDLLDDRMVVFGGFDASYELRNDTWVLSLGETPTWSELTVSGTPPSERYDPTAIYDPLRERMIVFGGYDPVLPLCSDTWALLLAGTPTWTELTPSGEPPSGRNAHTAIYDPVRDRMVVFGGYDPVRRNDTHALSLGGALTWSELTPFGTLPSPRELHTAIHDPVWDRMVVFGGYDGTFYYDDTWALSLGETPSWSELVPSLGTKPPGRFAHTAIYDPVRDRMVIFGIVPELPPPPGDTWALSLGWPPTWSELTSLGTPPPPRWSHTAIYDPMRDRMVVFGGYLGIGGSLRNDTWVLSLAGTPTWSELTPSGTAPSARYGHTAIYDPVRDRMVVFAGHDSTHWLNDTWALALAGTPSWSQLVPSGTPPSRRGGHTAVYDPVRDRMVIFAGYYYRHDTWALSLAGTPTWTELTPSGTLPSGRVCHTAICDPVRDRMVVFGGQDSTYYSLNDTWALALGGPTTWSELTPSGTPPSGRNSHTAIHDPVRDRMLVFGAAGRGNDTWGLIWAPTAVAERGTQLPLGLALHPACPNPANGPTLIRYEVPVAGPVRLEVYDVAGRFVRRLVEGPVPGGRQQVEWDGRDEGGKGVASGVYYVRVETSGQSLTGKAVILR